LSKSRRSSITHHHHTMIVVITITSSYLAGLSCCQAILLFSLPFLVWVLEPISRKKKTHYCCYNILFRTPSSSLWVLNHGLIGLNKSYNFYIKQNKTIWFRKSKNNFVLVKINWFEIKLTITELQVNKSEMINQTKFTWHVCHIIKSRNNIILIKINWFEIKSTFAKLQVDESEMINQTRFTWHVFDIGKNSWSTKKLMPKHSSSFKNNTLLV